MFHRVIAARCIDNQGDWWGRCLWSHVCTSVHTIRRPSCQGPGRLCPDLGALCRRAGPALSPGLAAFFTGTTDETSNDRQTLPGHRQPPAKPELHAGSPKVVPRDVAADEHGCRRAGSRRWHRLDSRSGRGRPDKQYGIHGVTEGFTRLWRCVFYSKQCGSGTKSVRTTLFWCFCIF